MEEEEAPVLTANDPGSPHAGSQALLNILQVDLDDE